MPLSKEQLDKLVCPEAREPLLYFPEGGEDSSDEFLFCPASRLRYRFNAGIPVLLIDEAERLDETAAGRLVAAALATE